MKEHQKIYYKNYVKKNKRVKFTNPYLENYKKLYAEFMDKLVDVHNYNLLFVKNVGAPTTKTLKRHIKELFALRRLMLAEIDDAFKLERYAKQSAKTIEDINKKCEEREMTRKMKHMTNEERQKQAEIKRQQFTYNIRKDRKYEKPPKPKNDTK